MTRDEKTDPSLFSFDEDQRRYLEENLHRRNDALSPFATRYEDAIYAYAQKVDPTADLVRPAFVRDVDRILNNPYYNRCMDKTQVFPFIRNDDLTRRSYHLQLVAQTSYKIGFALRLNTDLIEAIALGHDMGHTPFGHGGEDMLSKLYHAHTGRYFNHNVHSVRILGTLAGARLSLQTFDGILCHCGEKAFERYEPGTCSSFDELAETMERCYTTEGASKGLRPSTLEGCVVRICDILAYLGKDRQDALNIGVLDHDSYYLQGNALGRNNSDIIRNASANIIKNSIGQDHLAMDHEVFSALMDIKDQNNRLIYQSHTAHEVLDSYIEPMMERVYERCLDDLRAGDESAPIWQHHISSWVIRLNRRYLDETEPNQVVVDYIASMTDEYFIALHNHLFPEHAIDDQELYRPYFT
jgi:dGTPase